MISFPVASSGDLTAENTEDTERENRDMNNSDTTGFDMISQLKSAFSFLPFASFLDLLHKSLFN